MDDLAPSNRLRRKKSALGRRTPKAFKTTPSNYERMPTRYTRLQNLTTDEWNDQHREVSITLRVMARVLVITCLFCVITVSGAPDIALLSSGYNVPLPFNAGEVPFLGFLILGPLMILGLLFYTHIFLDMLNRLEQNLPTEKTHLIKRLPYLVNAEGIFARVCTFFIFYIIAPLSILTFCFRTTSGNPTSNIIANLIAIALLVCLSITHYQRNIRKPKTQFVLTGQGIIVLLILPPVAFLLPKAIVPLPVWTLNVKVDNDKKDSLQGLIAVNYNLPGANLNSINLSGADLRGANLSGADLHEADLSGANLRWANLNGANLNGANLSEAKISRANLGHALLVEANLSKADLRRANLNGAYLSRVDLSGADLRIANLSHAPLIGANLSRADFREANFGLNFLSERDLRRADLTGADLRFTFFDIRSIGNAKGNYTTRLPLDSTYPDNWLSESEIRRQSSCGDIWRPYLVEAKECGPRDMKWSEVDLRVRPTPALTMPEIREGNGGYIDQYYQ